MIILPSLLHRQMRYKSDSNVGVGFSGSTVPNRVEVIGSLVTQTVTTFGGFGVGAVVSHEHDKTRTISAPRLFHNPPTTIIVRRIMIGVDSVLCSDVLYCAWMCFAVFVSFPFLSFCDLCMAFLSKAVL